MTTPAVHTADISVLRVPFPRPIADSTHRIEVMDLILLELTDVDGRQGMSYALGFDYATDVLVEMLREASRHAIDTSPADRTQIWAAGWQRYEYIGRSGVAAWGLAALDIALWDLYAAQLGQPLWALLGGAQRSVPIYGSGGWLSYSDAELVDEARSYLERGYGGYKMKVGRRVDDDARRVLAVRAALGGDVPLMIDANQGYGLADAQRLARLVADAGITWFEEPLPINRTGDYATLRGGCGIPIALGERAFYPDGMQAVIDNGGVDVVMPDVLRIGGVRPWLDMAAIAAHRGLAVAPHFYREFDATLAAATSNTVFVEGFSWTDEVFDWSATIADGVVTPSDAPGFGLALRDDARNGYFVRSCAA